MIAISYTVFAVSVTLYAWARGAWEERTAATVVLAASIVTAAVYRRMGQDFVALQYPLLVSEGIALAILLAVAYRSTRFWPLFVAAFQLATFIALMTPWFGKNIVSYALGLAQGVWAYPQLVAIALGTARGQHARKTGRQPG